jgi:hypothetical protein
LATELFKERKESIAAIPDLPFRHQFTPLSVAASSTRTLSKQDRLFHASSKISRCFATMLKVLLYLAVFSCITVSQ